MSYNGEPTISMTTLRKYFEEIFEWLEDSPMTVIHVTKYGKPYVVLMGISAWEWVQPDSYIQQWESEGGAT